MHESIVAARAQRYALVDGEFEFGLVGVAALVRDFEGWLVAALSVSAPRFHLGGGWRARGGSQEGAYELFALLGGYSGA